MGHASQKILQKIYVKLKLNDASWSGFSPELGKQILQSTSLFVPDEVIDGYS